MNDTAGLPPPLEKLLWRALRLRCPACGAAPIFTGWFAMPDRCPHCHRPFRRDPGYLLGSIYFNYGVTASIVLVAYLVGYFTEIISPDRLMPLLALVALFFPLWFFRYARALWLAFDEFFDPWR